MSGLNGVEKVETDGFQQTEADLADAEEIGRHQEAHGLR